MELKDTLDLMTSGDYKDRFKAEYLQVKIRMEKLHATNVKYKEGALPFKPSCPLELLVQQERVMREYLRLLEIRAQIEEINLT